MRRTTLGMAVALGLILTASAQPAVIDLGSFTRDSAQSLDFLDVTATAGLSYNQALLVTGYRHATGSEVTNLLLNAGVGLEVGNSYCVANISCFNSMITLVENLGVTFPRSNENRVSGISHNLGAIDLFYGTAPFNTGVASGNGSGYLNFGQSFVGHYLVQNSGATALNPILPTTGGDCSSGQFCFGETPVQRGTPTFFDPIVATGYDFESQNGLNFQTVVIPNAYGDGSFDLFLFDSSGYVDSGADLTTGTVLDFAALGFADGVARFSIRGIETSANVDPNDPTGFVTGLTFSADGTTDFSMTPITFDTDAPTTPTPEPGTLVLLAAGLAAIGAARHRRSKRRRKE